MYNKVKVVKMPIYTYKCEECGTKYEIFHKVREDERAIVCPSCGSIVYKKVMSTTGILSSSPSESAAPTCEYGGCCSGTCSLN
jgi:putative FmdB family regulatory protein